MKLSTALLFISWIPLIQLQLFRFKGELNWFFLISIVFSLFGVWLLMKSIPKNGELYQSVIPVVSIVVLSIIGFGIPVLLAGILFTSDSAGDLRIVLLYSFALLTIASIGVWHLYKFTGKRMMSPVYKDIVREKDDRDEEKDCSKNKLLHGVSKKRRIYQVKSYSVIYALFFLIGFAILFTSILLFPVEWERDTLKLFLFTFFLASVLLALLLWGYLQFLKKMKPLKSMIHFILLVFFYIILFGIPVLYCILEIQFDDFQNIVEINSFLFAIPNFNFKLITGIISAVLSCFVLFWAWKEVQKEDKPYIPVLKFILASIFVLWQLNLGIHHYYNLPFDLMNHWVMHVPGVQKMYSYLEPLQFFKLLIFVFIGYVILNLLFFGGIFFKGKFKGRQPLFFSSTGLLMIIGSFALIFVSVNAAQLLPEPPQPGYSYLHWHYDLNVIITSFITVIGPVLAVAVTITSLGGILSFFKRGWGQTRFPGVVRKKGIVIAMSAVILYMFIFKIFWPLQDPALDTLFGMNKNQGVVFRLQSDPYHIIDASRIEILLYGKRAVIPLVNKLYDDDATVRKLSAYFLMFLGDEQVVEPLMEALKDKDKDVRYKAGDALENLAMHNARNPRVVELLIRALGDKDKYVRDSSAEALMHCRDFELLLKKLDAEDKDIRYSIVDILGTFRDRRVRVVDKLIGRLSKEKVDYVIWKIMYVLEGMTGGHYRGNWPEAAEWWQHWWNKNREDFVKRMK